VPPVRALRYSIRAIQKRSVAAQLGTVDPNILSTEITMNKTTTLLRAMTLGTVVAFSVGAAHASAAGLANDQSVSDGNKKYVVRFPDLDLSTMNGAAALYARLTYAARVVCEPLEGRALAIVEKHRTCMDQAIAHAVASVDRPLVSQYHQLRSKGDKAGLVQLARSN
jgi:UrcA family protein